LREFARLARIVGQQAIDAERHVLEAARRVESRSGLEAEILADDVVQAAPGGLEQRPQAGNAAARADAPQSLRDEDAVVEVQRHDIGHGTECHEVEQVGRIDLRSGGKQAVIPQPPGQRGHHVESDADAGQRLRSERLAGKIRVHDRRSVRQHRPGQVVIRDQHFDAESPGLRDSLE